MKPATKPLSLPKPIAAYFAADNGDGDAVSQCFTENAIVKDEGHTHSGRAAIKTWKTETSTKYPIHQCAFCGRREGRQNSCNQPSGWKLSRQSGGPSILFQT